MTDIIETLQNRGFIYQTTHDQELRDHLRTPRTYYVGFDPTADSLHVGSLVPIMAMAHLQKAGHKPIAIVGGGTARVGDPSGKTEMRKMLTAEQIEQNQAGLHTQLSRYLNLDGQAGRLINNDQWLLGLGYVDFLREVGCHFSINRMLTAESVKLRLETGLSFIEFNYMLLQAYDFYILMRDYQCSIQMGGQDQWGNIVAGIDLCRRMGIEEQTFGITFPLIMNSNGTKFGKSVEGNVWLSAERTSPLDYYQFWRNVDDTDVKRFLLLFTFLPESEIAQLTADGANINRAKEILGFEATRLNHGLEAAQQAFATAVTRFGQADPQGEVQTSSAIREVAIQKVADMPEVAVQHNELGEIGFLQLLVRAEFAASNSEARRLIQGGGVKMGERVITDPQARLEASDLAVDPILRAGKKRFKKVVVQ
ncbi:MAG: tyrosine--tRNA ligase [Acidobacteria bacterium]|nr:tyrosine--tRNA ligase [Acidobacteriota bacterium]MCB9397351.1 tyrosine--tRNA ligase [Acidobacteriota bacterium]